MLCASRLLSAAVLATAVALAALAVLLPAPAAAEAPTPDDPLLDEQDYLGQIKVDALWEHTTGEPSAESRLDDPPAVAILSDGVTSHVDVPTPVTSTVVVDDPEETFDAHTQAASLATALTDNGDGMAGVCWQCRLMSAHITNGGLSTTSADAAADGIDWAVAEGADVVFMPYAFTYRNDALREAINAADAAGVLVVTLAWDDESFPGSHPATLTVGALDGRDAGYELRGEWDSHDQINVGAPGCDILAAEGESDYYTYGGCVDTNAVALKWNGLSTPSARGCVRCTGGMKKWGPASPEGPVAIGLRWSCQVGGGGPS